MDDLFCDEVSVLLEVPDVQHNSLETPEELLDDDDDASIDTFLGSLPSCSSEDHAHGRLHVLLELEARQRTSDYLRRQPHFDSTHRFSIVQWLHVVRVRWDRWVRACICVQHVLMPMMLLMPVHMPRRSLPRLASYNCVWPCHLAAPPATSLSLMLVVAATRRRASTSSSTSAHWQSPCGCWTVSWTCASCRCVCCACC